MKGVSFLNILILFLCNLTMVDCNESDDPIPSSPPTINMVDSLVMVDFYHSMKLNQWDEPYDWDLIDPNTWMGVEFLEDENGLKYIGGIKLLYGKNFNCSLPASIGNLKYLVGLILHDIPHLQETLPESIYDCPMNFISIADCSKFTGALSSQIAQWGKTITEIVISRTGLQKEIPKEIGQCKLSLC